MNGAMLLAQMYWKQSNDTDMRIFYWVVGIGLAALAVWVAYQQLAHPSQRTVSRRSEGYYRSSFRKRASAIGFSDAEIGFLEGYARKMGVTSPQAALANRASVDAFFRSVFKYVEKHSETEEIAESAKAQLFAIREAMAIRISSGPPVRSTRQLVKRTPISIIDHKGSHYSSIIVEVDPRFLYVEPALDAFGQIIRFGRGSKATVYFYTGNHMGFSFNTRASGYSEYEGRQILALRHSEGIKPLPTRKHQRKQATTPCRFFLVHVSVSRERGKSLRSVRTEKAAAPGMIIDISAGGMSIQTATPAAAGEFLKIVFTLAGKELSVFASVVRTNRIRAGGNAMHVKFVKISRNTANRILAAVYGYD